MTRFSYGAVDEQTLYIDLPNANGLKIKTILRGDLQKPLVVIVHGRHNTGNDTKQYLFARYLYEKGLSSLRIFLYDSEPHTRDLVDCTVHTHAQDLDTVVEYLKKHQTPHIFAVGSSYGGPTILLSQASLDGAALWDASHGLFWRTKEYIRYINRMKKVGKLSVGTDGKGYVVGATLPEELKWGDTSDWAKKPYPLLIVTAPEGELKNYGKKYFVAAKEPKKYLEIPGATHSFLDSDKITLRLFNETANWFNEILHGK